MPSTRTWSSLALTASSSRLSAASIASQGMAVAFILWSLAPPIMLPAIKSMPSPASGASGSLSSPSYKMEDTKLQDAHYEGNHDTTSLTRRAPRPLRTLRFFNCSRGLPPPERPPHKDFLIAQGGYRPLRDPHFKLIKHMKPNFSGF